MPIYPLKCTCGYEEEQVCSYADIVYLCPHCGLKMSQDYAAKQIQKTDFFEGTHIMKDGKRYFTNDKRLIRDYAAKNNLIIGGDDLEQESEHNRKRNDESLVERTTEKIMETIERKKVLSKKSQKKKG